MIDCKKLANEIADTLEKTKRKKKGLAIIGIETDNNNTLSYINMLKKDCQEYNFSYSLHLLPRESTTGQLKQVIMNLNNNPNIGGIVLAEPLPSTIDRNEIIAAIDASKDIDGCKGVESGYIPATVHSIMTIIYSIYSSIVNKDILLIGKGNIGQAIIPILLEQGANLTICHSKTSPQRLNIYCLSSEIIISTAGVNDIINEHSIMPDESDSYTIIDVGRGDVSEKVCNIVDRVTPKHNGVGLVTRMLLLNHLMEEQYD